MKLARTAVAFLVATLATGAHADAGTWVLVAHGGAGDYSRMPPERLEARRAALETAMRRGAEVLRGGGRSVDAVVVTIRSLEDCGEFDAGRGSYYGQDGVPELDAALMDGATLAAGSVAALRRIANPIDLARLVMDRTHHVMLVGVGAEEFARAQGVDLVSPYHFFNEREWERYRKARAGSRGAAAPAVRGTVGVVALDRSGHLAAGTSTGGTVLKMAGRVGDSPLIGAGTYANDASCAVSATGTGEYFIRNVVAADVCFRVRHLGTPLEKAAGEVVMKELVAQGGDGGVIALDRRGDVATPHNTPGMLTGIVREGGPIRLEGWAPGATPVERPASP